VLALYSSIAAGEQILDLQAGLLYDSNLSRAQLERDIKSDTAALASLQWGQFIPVADGLAITAGVDVRTEIYGRYSGLDNVNFGGWLSVRRKIGLGALAPWISAHASAGRLEYRNSIRDGWRYSVGVSAGKRITERLNLRADYWYEARTADREEPVVASISGAVFDLEGHNVGIAGDYALTDRLTIFAGYTVREGDVASSTQRNRAIFRNSTAITRDPVFGDNVFGYRINATTHAGRLGLSCGLGDANSLNFAVERWVSRGEGGLDYYNTLVGASYVHSF
jgi:hypothetical protein